MRPERPARFFPPSIAHTVPPSLQIDVIVEFDLPVIVVGVPRIQLDTGFVKRSVRSR
jgi:hypothetical protein